MSHCPYCALAKWACPRHGEDAKKTKENFWVWVAKKNEGESLK